MLNRLTARRGLVDVAVSVSIVATLQDVDDLLVRIGIVGLLTDLEYPDKVFVCTDARTVLLLCTDL